MAEFKRLWLAVIVIVPAAVYAGEAPTGIPAETQKTLLSYLPADGFQDGFKRQVPVAFYDQSNLYEYIDGQAEGYIAYNFQALVSATYSAQEEANSVVVDVYDMEKPIQAFGLYSTFRAPSNQFVDLGAQGFKTGEGYMFWKGRYVVRTTADLTDNGEIPEAALAAAKAVDSKITDDRAGLEMLALLPTEGRIANSEKYIMRAVLGQGFLNNGVTAEYPGDKTPARLFVCDMGAAEEARKAYSEYLKFATAHGKPVETEKGSTFYADVKYYGTTEVFVKGSYIAGGVALPQNRAALMAKLKERLPESAQAQKPSPN